MATYTYDQLFALAKSVGLSDRPGTDPSYGGAAGSACDVAASVALAESGGNSNDHYPPPAGGDAVASTGESSYGLWQINMDPSYAAKRRQQLGVSSNRDLYVPATNAHAMAVISNGGRDWSAWTTYTSGKYKKFYKGLQGHDLSVTSPKDLAGAALATGAAAGAPLGGIEAIGAFFAALLEWSTWMRVLQIVGGLSLLVAGVLIMRPDLATKAASTAALAA